MANIRRLGQSAPRGQVLVPADILILLDPTSASFTQALPPAASTPIGTQWEMKHVGNNLNTVTLDANASELIDDGLTLVLEKGDAIQLFNTGTKWLVLPSLLTIRRNRIEVAERMPTGTILPFSGIIAPVGFFKTDGATPSRTLYPELFNAITIQQTATTTSGSTSVTGLTSTANMAVGMPLSGPGIQVGTTIAGIPNATSITLSGNATATASGVTLVVAPYGVGDSSTTFTLPDTRAVFLRGAGAQTVGGITYNGVQGQKQTDQFQGHIHQQRITQGGGGGSLANQGIAGSNASLLAFERTNSPEADYNGNGTPRVGTETRPVNLGVNYIIKY